MCISLPQKVVKIQGDFAVMEDGREVRVDMIRDVAVGDVLEVYGDIALSRIVAVGANINDTRGKI